MFNFKLILNVLGTLLIALSILMLIPTLTDLIKSNQTWVSFFIASLFCLGFGISLFLSTRGVHEPGISMVTSQLLGKFRTDASTRSEFFSMIGQGILKKA